MLGGLHIKSLNKNFLLTNLQANTNSRFTIIQFLKNQKKIYGKLNLSNNNLKMQISPIIFYEDTVN